MVDGFDYVKWLLKIGNVCIDNNIFRLHYKVTVIILVACSLMVMSHQYFGDPIVCIADGVPLNVLETFCWIQLTYTIPKRDDGRIGKDVVQPGVAFPADGEQMVKYYKYYQWVGLVMLLQALFFYLPKYLWQTWQSSVINMLVPHVIGEDCEADRKKLLIDYFATQIHVHNFYAIRFFLCEFLNFVNVIAQIILMDYLLEGEFSTYGLDVLRFIEMKPEEREDPMERVFPKVSKCTFQKYGPSGSIQNLDGLCLLPLNNVNEKIYVFLWFWFMLVAVLSGLNLVYRITIVVMPKFRLLLLRTRCRLAARNDIETIFKKCWIDEWFVMYKLAKNIDPLIFKDLVSDLAKGLDNKQCV